MVIKSKAGTLIFLLLAGIFTMAIFLVPAWHMGLFATGEIREASFEKIEIDGLPSLGDYYKTGKKILEVKAAYEAAGLRCRPAEMLLNDTRHVVKGYLNSVGGCLAELNINKVRKKLNREDLQRLTMPAGRGIEVKVDAHPVFAVRKAIGIIQKESDRRKLKTLFPVLYYIDDDQTPIFRVIFVK